MIYERLFNEICAAVVETEQRSGRIIATNISLLEGERIITTIRYRILGGKWRDIIWW